jgi:Flp pilus assembly protein TadD
MKRQLIFLILPGLFLAACSHMEFVHVPPGESVLVSTARRGEAMPRAVPMDPALAEVRPDMPGHPQSGETVSDYYALGAFCLQQERYDEAVVALEKAVQLDPGYAEAWNSLAVAYQNKGDEVKAREAFKKYKSLSAR